MPFRGLSIDDEGKAFIVTNPNQAPDNFNPD